MNAAMALLFDPSGQIDRGQFWKGYGLIVLAVIVLVALTALSSYVPELAVLSVFVIIPFLALIWSAWALPIKRLRDCGISPWWLLLNFVPIVGGIAGLVLFCICGFKEGEPGPEAAGEDEGGGIDAPAQPTPPRNDGSRGPRSLPLALIAAAGLGILAVAIVGWLYWQLDSTQDDLAATQADLDSKTVTLNATHDALRSTIIKHNNTAKTLDHTQAALEAERVTRNRLEEDKTALVANVNALTGSLHAANGENARLNRDLNAAAGRETRLRTNLADETAAHVKTKTVLASLESDHAELTATFSEFRSLYGDADALKQEIASLQEQRRPLVLQTNRNGLRCTGSMEPKLTCLDEVTILRNYAPRNITVGTIVVFQGERECVEWHEWGPSLAPIKSCTRYRQPNILHRVMEIGSHSYLTKGDANRENDGWIAVDRVLGYVVEVHKGVHTENARLRFAVNGARNRLGVAEDALDEAEAAWAAQVDKYCGSNTGCEVGYYDETDPVYIIWQQYKTAYAAYSRAFDDWDCWMRNAEDSQYPGHIPHSCD